MIELGSPRWAELQHAYGSAAKIPALLRQLRDMPDDERNAEPWFSLWSALAHQGDVYSASFAAIPHVVDALSAAPESATAVYFHFPAWVEICRRKNGVEIPDDLAGPYFDALGRLPDLVARVSGRAWDALFTACVLSAVAAAKGEHTLAEAILEMSSPEVAGEFLEGLGQR